MVVMMTAQNTTDAAGGAIRAQGQTWRYQGRTVCVIDMVFTG